MDTTPKAAEYKCLSFRLSSEGELFKEAVGVVKKNGTE